MSTLWTPSGEHPVPRKPSSADQARSGTDQARSGQSRFGQPQGSAPANAPAGTGSPGPGAPSHLHEGHEDVGAYSEQQPHQGRSGGDADAELDAIREQLLQAPVEMVVANHAMGLWELAALHLSQNPPGLAQAKLAIDALGALLDGVQGQLGEAEPTLAEGLSNIRLAFVQIANAAHGKPGP